MEDRFHRFEKEPEGAQMALKVHAHERRELHKAWPSALVA
jgi:hypothetical protein